MPMIDHTKNIIEVQDVSYAFGDESVLEHISFNIHKGDYIGMIGPNGGGKTTLLKIMLGLLKPMSGAVKLFGIDIKEFHDWSKVGYVPQNAVRFNSQFPATVTEIVSMGLYAKKGLFHNLNTKDKKEIDKAIAQVGMEEYKDRLIGYLSGGQQQRVFIARALVGDPQILFLDEPTIGVDVKQQEKFYRLLTDLNKKHDITLVLISHELDVVAHEATEFACINHRLVYHGTPQDFMKGDHLTDLYGKNLKFIVHNH